MNPVTLFVHDYMSIQNVRPKELSILISINDPGMEPPRAAATFVDRLNVTVHDIDDVSLAAVKGYKVFDDAQAQELLEFVHKHRLTGIDHIYVHCLAGVCRSSGTAAALSKIYNGDDSYYYSCGRYVPNAHIKSMLLQKAVDMKIWDPHAPKPYTTT